MVMGGYSCPEGRGLKYQHCIPDGHFSHIFVVKLVMFILKNEKVVGDGPFFKKEYNLIVNEVAGVQGDCNIEGLDGQT